MPPSRAIMAITESFLAAVSQYSGQVRERRRKECVIMLNIRNLRIDPASCKFRDGKSICTGK